MNKRHPFLLVLTSAILNTLLWFLDEGTYSLSFLTDLNELGNWIFFVVIFSALGLGIYSIFNATRVKRYALEISFLAFSPLLLAIALSLLI